MSDTHEFERLSPEALAGLIEGDDAPVLLDTHVRDRFADVHLPGARNAPVLEVVFLDTVREAVPDRGASIVVYGSRAETADATTAADKLRRAGYGNLAILEGGLEGWRAAGLPLQGDSPDAETATPGLPDGTFEMDTDACEVEWAGRNANTTHDGTVPVSEGSLTVEGGRLAGRFVVDLTRIRNQSLAGDDLQPVLIAHLESDDFFFTKLFPTAVFELTEGVPIEAATATSPNYSVAGTLTLRGMKADLSFDATITARPDGRISAEAHFDIDRTRWGVVYGSAGFFDHLGMHLVFDRISLRLRLLTR